MTTPLAPLLKPDAFWDSSQGGGVRCSSTGADASRYQDPGAAYFEKNEGRSIAQCMPMGNRVRGVVVPRATMWGGSRGFDPHKPRIMNVDPDIEGQSSAVDYSMITKEVMAAAYEAAWAQVGEYGDPRLVASQAYRNLAISTEPVGMRGGLDNQLVDPNRDRPPVAGLDVYVAPRAMLGGGQAQRLTPVNRAQFQPQEITVSPSVSAGPPAPPRDDQQSVMAMPDDMNQATPRQLKQAAVQASVRPDPWGNPVAPQQPRQEMAPPPNMRPQPAQSAPLRPSQPLQQPLPAFPIDPFARQSGLPSAPAQVVQQGGPPTERVLFEIQGWGKMEASFHKIVCNGSGLFVFVWDTRCQAGKLFPPKMEPREDGSPSIAVFMLNKPDRIYYIHSTGQTFEHDGYEYCVCVVAKEVTV